MKTETNKVLTKFQKVCFSFFNKSIGILREFFQNQFIIWIFKFKFPSSAIHVHFTSRTYTYYYYITFILIFVCKIIAILWKSNMDNVGSKGKIVSWHDRLTSKRSWTCMQTYVRARVRTFNCAANNSRVHACVHAC